MAGIILAAIDQKRGAREQAETKLSFFKTPLTYRWLTRFRSMLLVLSFSRTGTASAMLNSLNSHVIASFPVKATHFHGVGLSWR